VKFTSDYYCKHVYINLAHYVHAISANESSLNDD